MKGRPPICLKCRQSGHLRKDCPEKTTTYASVTNSRRVQHQPQTTVPPTPASPVPQVPVSTESVPQEPTTETANCNIHAHINRGDRDHYQR
ncbi:hypothetical protein ACJMK2_038800 [Sinanodonta woodiana]|uniref:CCHC-type domain-containing protein n=1 Tax=Sinanodonta woodiana TaxID=1069815 RepID=A0ABD3WA16_SINWO